jgi:hypothetical protein
METLLEDELETNANRGVRAGAGVLTAPQPARSMGGMKIRLRRAIFFTDNTSLLIET